MSVSDARKDACPTTGMFSLVVVHRRAGPDGTGPLEFLAVDESRDRGWWLPAGHVKEMESYEKAALRETKEEAGIDVKLTGILRVEHSWRAPKSARQRVVFLAEPLDVNQKPKDVPDEESNGARWLTLEELESGKYRQRGSELVDWARYMSAGGDVAPLWLLGREGSKPPPVNKVE